MLLQLILAELSWEVRKKSPVDDRDSGILIWDSRGAMSAKISCTLTAATSVANSDGETFEHSVKTFSLPLPLPL